MPVCESKGESIATNFELHALSRFLETLARETVFEWDSPDLCRIALALNQVLGGITDSKREEHDRAAGARL